MESEEEVGTCVEDGSSEAEADSSCSQLSKEKVDMMGDKERNGQRQK
jgi:hypothetical protein